MYSHAIFTETGGYPDQVRRIVDANSEKEGLQVSRLPKFTANEIESLKGSADFFGLNYYTSFYVEEGVAVNVTYPSFAADQNALLIANETWPVAKSWWLRSIPVGLRDALL